MAIQGVCPTCGNKVQDLEVRPQPRRGKPVWHSAAWQREMPREHKDGEVILDIVCLQGHYVTQVVGPAADVERDYQHEVERGL